MRNSSASSPPIDWPSAAASNDAAIAAATLACCSALAVRSEWRRWSCLLCALSPPPTPPVAGDARVVTASLSLSGSSSDDVEDVELSLDVLELRELRVDELLLLSLLLDDDDVVDESLLLLLLLELEDSLRCFPGGAAAVSELESGASPETGGAETMTSPGKGPAAATAAAGDGSSSLVFTTAAVPDDAGSGSGVVASAGAAVTAAANGF